MVFSSLLFIYAFLPICLIFYSLMKGINGKNIVLLIFSLLFYTWGEPVYVLLLLFMTFWDWFSALLIEKTETEAKNHVVMLEVDFVANKGNQRFYIQSTLNIDSSEKKNQETKSLQRIDDSFKKIVVVKDDIEPWIDEKGIQYIGVQDFLLDEEFLR